MKRREFITLIGATTAWPFAARAQQPVRMRRIGLLLAYAESDPEARARVEAFRQRLKELGWIEGRGFKIEYRYIPDLDRIHDAAAELVGLRPDLIVVNTIPARQRYCARPAISRLCSC
jgi:putative tryptophan/tyrosine transport system substrate-binding protein